MTNFLPSFESGGRLLLTDSALRGLEALGLAQEGSVERGVAYMGYVDLDLQHPLAEGVAPLGQGEVVFIGALLPPANNALYHPYGLADYALSATGYQLVYNALDIALEAVGAGQAPPQDEGAATPPRGLPGAEGALALLGLAVVALAARRRR